jgi:hypothetical protein
MGWGSDLQPDVAYATSGCKWALDWGAFFGFLQSHVAYATRGCKRGRGGNGRIRESATSAAGVHMGCAGWGHPAFNPRALET